MMNIKTYTISLTEKEALISIIEKALSAYQEIHFAYVFGSFIDPENQFFSDIDKGNNDRRKDAEGGKV